MSGIDGLFVRYVIGLLVIGFLTLKIVDYSEWGAVGFASVALLALRNYVEIEKIREYLELSDD